MTQIKNVRSSEFLINTLKRQSQMFDLLRIVAALKGQAFSFVATKNLSDILSTSINLRLDC